MLTAVFMAVDKINVKEAEARTPGYDTWGNCVQSVEVGVSYADSSLTIDTSAWGSTDVHYLWYPVYENLVTTGDRSASTFTWEGPYEVNGYPVRVTATGGTADVLDTGGAAITFNRSGMYIFDDLVSTHLGNDPSTYNGSIWVNTSTNYSISSIDDIRFNDTSASVSIAVTDYLGDGVPCTISVIAPDSTTAWHGYRTTGAKTLGVTNFTMAGIYTVQAYRDTDYDGSTGIYTYPDGETNYEAYNTSNLSVAGDFVATGKGPNFPTGGTNDPTTGGDVYNFSNLGPWDPPEYNATPVTFEVLPGVPTITLTNATPVYWGFDVRIDINVTDYDGHGIYCGANFAEAQGKILLKKSSNYYDNVSDYPATGSPPGPNGDAGIWFNTSYDHLGNYAIGDYYIELLRGAAAWSVNITNGTWYVVYQHDTNGDGTYEWNGSTRFSITSSSPAVDLVITNDGFGTGTAATDMKIDVPQTAPGTGGAAQTNTITFKIYGRSVAGRRAYYGDADEGRNSEHPEDYKNITLSGDILYQPVLTDSVPSGAGNVIHNCGGGVWTVNVTPTKPGGTITISIDWPGANNGSDSETISIVNGTNVEVIEPSLGWFTFGDHQNLTVKVTNQQGIVENNAAVYVFWEGQADNINTSNVSQNNAVAMTPVSDGLYTFWLNPNDACFSGITAPRNITIAAKTAGQNFWGYTTIEMRPKHDLYVNVSPTMSYAGNPEQYDIDITLADGSAPPTYSDLTIALYDMDSNLITGTDAWSETAKYDINDELIFLSAGTYQLYAYNNTHDSEGHNATITVDYYTVTSSPSVLCWLIDTSQNITFQVNSPITNGTLTINNMSSALNGSSITTSGSSTHDIAIENGIGTVEGFNATTIGNLTYSYTPTGGESRPAQGLTQITTATATPMPDTIYVGETTEVTIAVTHPATGLAIPDVLVGLDEGMNLSASVLAKLPTSKETGSDGKVIFGIKSEATGNVTIYVKGGTDPTKPQVIYSKVRQTMKISAPPSVNEGDTFTVKAKDANGNLITDATVTVTFNGQTYTTTTGETGPISSPTVGTTLDYPIEATAEGYTPDDTTIKVINKPQIVIEVKEKVESGKTFTVKAGGDDGNSYGIAVTFNGETKTTVGPDGVSFKAPKVSKDTDYTITASKDGYLSPAEEITIKVFPGTPGFELLTLIVAIGIAFILLRRRRRK